jgi:acetyl esterase/lipase
MPSLEPIMQDLATARKQIVARNLDRQSRNSQDRVDIIDLELVVPGQTSVPIRLYRPKAIDREVPTLIWAHAGGFVMGSHTMDHEWCCTCAVDAACAVLSVGYRLAPEHPYPAALDDFCFAVDWVAASGTRYGLSIDRVALGGKSAGGGIAAGACAKLRDTRGTRPVYMLLVFPAVDDRPLYPSAETILDPRVWNGSLRRWSWELYLRDCTEPIPPYAAPMRLADLSGLPPCYILVADLDPMRDEGIAFAERLRIANVSCELKVIPRAFHGFDAFAPQASLSVRATTECIAALRQAFT